MDLALKKVEFKTFCILLCTYRKKWEKYKYRQTSFTFMLESVEDVFDLACNKERNFSLVLGQQNRQTSGMSHCDMFCKRPTVLATVEFLRWMVRMIWQFDFHHHFLWAASE